MTDINDLVLRISADMAGLRAELEKAKSQIERFRADAEKGGAGAGGALSAGLGRAAVGAGMLVAALGGLSMLRDIGQQVVETTARFQKLEASLKTVTGSSQAAQAVFAGLKDFAATTPFSLEEVTQAFIKMKAMGLDPSQAALTSYGNTASAMGRGLDQMIEAVADAAMGEFERLKEFGIRASSQGDRVAFTFDGVTTTVAKNATAIQGYLRSLGDTKFANAMEEQANTVGGALSNLGDQWDQLMVNLGDTMPIQKAITALGDLIALLNDWMVETPQETLEDLRKQLRAFDYVMNNSQDHATRALRTAGTPQNERALAKRAALLQEIAAAEKAVADQEQKRREGESVKPAGETPEEKQKRLLQAQLDALRRGGVQAWEAVARAQKMAEGGLGAIQAQMDELKSSLSDAAKYDTPFEAWAKEVERLNDLLAAGRISLATYQAQVAANSPGKAMMEASAPPADLSERVNRQIEETLEKIVQQFREQLPEPIERQDSLATTSWAAVNAIIQKQQEASQGAADALGNVFTRIQSGDWGAVAEGVGIFQDRLREVEKSGLSGADALAAVGESLLNTAEAGLGFANMLGKLMGRDADQNKNAQIGGAIGSTVGQFLPGGKAVLAFAGNMIGSAFGGNAKEDLLAQKLTAERDALSKTINSFLEAGTEMTDTGRRIKELNERFGAMRIEAERLNQPLDEITRSYQAQMRAIAKGLEEDLADVLDRAEGRDALADYRALMREQEDRVQDALIAEVDLSRVRAANAAELSAFFRGLADDQLALFAGVERQVARVQAQVAQLTRSVSTQIDDQISQYRDLSEQLKSQASTLRGLVKQLRETISGWDIGPDSALGLDQQLTIAGQRFAEMVAKARGGDQDAIAGLPDLANTYRDIARQFYGSSEAFFQVEDAIKGALAQVAMVTDARATGIEQLASLSLVQVQLLGDLKSLLAADLAQPVADQIAAALADGQLTIGEADAITGALDSLGTRLEGVTGPAAQAAQAAVQALETAVTTGNIAAIAPAMQTLDGTLSAFRTDQIAAYTDALGRVAATIAAVDKWVLDPDGLIPAAVGAAFRDLKFDQTLNTRIENTFRAAIGVTPLPLPLTGTIRDLVGDAVGKADTGASATARMEALIEQAISAPTGGWSPAQTLRSQVQTQFASALGSWGGSPLTQRINDAFSQALGGATGTDWRGTLQSVLSAGSPLLTALDGLRSAMDDLRTAVASEAAGAGGQAAYDQALQGFVSPVARAAGTAWGMLTGAQDVDADKGKMTNTVIQLDASTGRELLRGGKDPDQASNARAQALAGGLSLVAQQIEALTGGDIGIFQVNASDKYGSGYDIGSAQKLQAFGINDFEGIARSFVLDALSQMTGGNARAIEILRNADLSDFQGGLSRAAQEIYRLLNPPAFADGGMFGGGLRLVGERGPELEVTGPARYFSAPQTASLVRGALAGPPGNAAEMAQLRDMNANLVRLVRVQSFAIEQQERGMQQLAAEMAQLSAKIDPDRRVA